MVPSVMAEWIATVVAPDSGVTASTLESKGLAVLKVRDLKRIRSSVYATGCVSIPQRVPSSANKGKLVDAMHALLRMDNHLLVTHINAELQPGGHPQATSHAARVPLGTSVTVQSSDSGYLRPQQNGAANSINRSNNYHNTNTTSTPHRGTTATSRSTSSSGRKRPVHQISSSAAPNPPIMPYPALLTYPNSGLPYPGWTAPYAESTNGTDGTVPQLGSMSSHYQNALQQIQNPLFAAASFPPNPNRPLTGGVANGQQRSSNPSNPGAAATGVHSQATAAPNRNRPASAPANGNTNNESTTSAGESNVPKTPQEFSFFNQLLAMGFQDRDEVMLGIRQSNASSVDEVMMWIIQQREEREEARKMDEARLRSEQLRKENADKQKRAFQKRLDAATSRDDFRDIFGQPSWVLDNLDDAHFRRLVSHHKNALVRLLRLESSTRKWYQDKLPTCYFRDLCHRSNQQAENEFDSWLIRECDTLESGLYKLELQQGGVPKLFIRAQENHPEYDESGENDESDDEIVFCGTRQSEGGN
mmetsp:Transcript_39838/g.96144  ORF Transcript_39838/g.96144 Transcript_39838/m.96144 type:complete len:531 (+) Transcript_39838:135-1727(+)